MGAGSLGGGEVSGDGVTGGFSGTAGEGMGVSVGAGVGVSAGGSVGGVGGSAGGGVVVEGSGVGGGFVGAGVADGSSVGVASGSNSGIGGSSPEEGVSSASFSLSSAACWASRFLSLSAVDSLLGFISKTRALPSTNQTKKTTTVIFVKTSPARVPNALDPPSPPRAPASPPPRPRWTKMTRIMNTETKSQRTESVVIRIAKCVIPRGQPEIRARSGKHGLKSG